jgi:regulator of ribonuclease activity B
MFEGIRSLLGRHPKRSEADQKLDQALAAAESLDHFFFFSDRDDAQAAADRLEQRGWTTQSLSVHPETQKWLLQVRQSGAAGVPLFGASGSGPANPEKLHDLQAELDLFADEHHGEYDGWQLPGFIEPE